MKAILRGSAGLSALLLLCSASFGYYFITPVSKIPYPQAPNMYTGKVYYYDAWGRVHGPYYALTPSFPPHRMPLPGPIGHAIDSGYLPHTLLMDKKAMTVGDAPLLGKHHAPKPGTPNGGPMQYPTINGGDVAARGPAQLPYTGVPTSPYPMQSPYSMGPGLYGSHPMPYGPMPPPYPPGPMAGMQQGPPGYPMQYPGPMAAPPGAMPMPYAGANSMPPNANMVRPNYGMMPMPQQPQQSVMPPWMMQNPYQPVLRQTVNWNQYAPNYYYQRDPRTGQVVLVQAVNPAQVPMMPIPGYNPAMPAMPSMPSMPGQPGLDMGGGNGFQYFGPMEPFNRMQGPQPPQMEYQPLQLPRMEMAAPQQIKGGGSAYPVHPLIRSPRDFFMWGEMMEEERGRGSRPNPIP